MLTEVLTDDGDGAGAGAAGGGLGGAPQKLKLKLCRHFLQPPVALTGRLALLRLKPVQMPAPGPPVGFHLIPK